MKPLRIQSFSLFMVIVFAVFALVQLILARPAQAQTRSCALVEQLAWDLGCNIATASTESSEKADKTKDFAITSSYGPSQCKTGASLKEAIKDLKEECSSWLKERKSDLKEKHLTGTCNEECTDCGSGLKKCTIRGIVHYSR